MPTRSIMVDGRRWRVMPSGFITPNVQDEFSLLFITDTEAGSREVRVTRYSPVTSRSREASLAELSDADLATLLGYSQPSDTSPEAGYAR